VCGIVGAVHERAGTQVDRGRFASVVGSLAHRGPDGAGEVHTDEFSFGHRRLTIIDLTEAGNQPMLDGDGQVCITYNGELYNYRALRGELAGRGHRFRSTSDTEVVLEAYKEWGIDCLQRFNGMFAFGLYDLRRRRFYLVRDRLGVKPVYHARIGGSLVFASELKAILRFPGFVPRLNARAISCYLSFRYPLGSDTYFEGVQQLEPGHYLEMEGGETRLTRYWELPLQGSRRWMGRRARAELKDLVADAVVGQTVSDVPLGAYLSGGLDSTIILHELSQRSGRPVRTFTVGFDAEGYDESEFATLAAAAYGAGNTRVAVGLDDYLSLARECIRYKDQPLGMHNEVALFLLARAARRHVKVVLAGEGADELFGGYGRLFRAPFDHRRLRAASLLPASLDVVAARRMGLPPEGLGLGALDYFLQRYSYFPWAEKARVLNAGTLEAVEEDASVLRYFRGLWHRARGRSFSERIAFLFIKAHLPGLLLMMDASSMASGLEVRVPFTDHRLAEVAFRLPARCKVRWRSAGHLLAAMGEPSDRYSEVRDTTKAVLRDLYGPSIPPAIRDRRKWPFPVPLTEWFSGDGADRLRAELLGSGGAILCVVDPDRLGAWIEEKRGGADPLYGRKAWLLLNLEYWLREYARLPD
jgi:asparagine synthase (glutamine-hydrolysing)